MWLENRRTQKWVRMIGKQLEDWEVYVSCLSVQYHALSDVPHALTSTHRCNRCQLRHASTLKRRIRKGVPEALRGRVWGHLAGASLMLRNNPGVYPSLLRADDASAASTPSDASSSSAACPTAVTDAIARDIERTFPKHYLFQAQRAGQGALFNVLCAYAQYDPDVGYCQGMGFLAAMFLSYMPEPQAFWLLVACLNHRRFALADLYRPRMPKVPELLFVCEQLMRAHLPRLAAHLEQEGLHPTMYLTQWLLTLFAYNFPFAFVTRVWDAFLHEGWKVIFRVALALLKLAQRACQLVGCMSCRGLTCDVYERAAALLALKFEAIMDFFRELPTKVRRTHVWEYSRWETLTNETWRQVDTELVLATAFKLPLKRAQLDSYRDQFQQQQQQQSK